MRLQGVGVPDPLPLEISKLYVQMHPLLDPQNDQFTRNSGVSVNEYAYLRMRAKYQHSDLRVVRSYIQSRDDSLHKFLGVPEVGRSDTSGIIQDEYNVF